MVLSASREVPEGVAAYKFDHCFNAGAKQEQVYEATVRPAVRAVLDGYNATVFAYGQTGTGKTYTMQGDENDPELMGMAPRAVHELFEAVALKLSDRASQAALSSQESEGEAEVDGAYEELKQHSDDDG